MSSRHRRCRRGALSPRRSGQTGCGPAVAADPALPRRLAEKARRFAPDEVEKPLSAYRAEELARMRESFFGFDPSYRVARYHLLTRVPHARTPFHLARHRGRLAAAPVEQPSRRIPP
jgi:hypothetical protein